MEAKRHASFGERPADFTSGGTRDLRGLVRGLVCLFLVRLFPLCRPGCDSPGRPGRNHPVIRLLAATQLATDHSSLYPARLCRSSRGAFPFLLSCLNRALVMG